METLRWAVFLSGLVRGWSGGTDRQELEGHMKLDNYFSFKVEDFCLKDIV